jgi:hypothetical protein
VIKRLKFCWRNFLLLIFSRDTSGYRKPIAESLVVIDPRDIDTMKVKKMQKALDDNGNNN